MSSSKFYLWKVFCIYENTFINVASHTRPNECPNDHPNKEIDLNQTTIVDYKLMSYDKSNNLIIKNNLINNTTYTDLQTNFFFNTDNMSNIVKIKVIGSIDSKAISATVRVYDYTHQLFLGSLTFTNTTVQILEFDVLDNLPSTDSLLEFSVKVSNSAGYANIKAIIVCYN